MVSRRLSATMKRLKSALVAVILVVTEARSQLLEDDKCRTGDGWVGVCKKLYECPDELAAVSTGRRPTICSYDRRIPVVCCPSAAPTSAPTPGPTTTARPDPEQTTTRAPAVDQQHGGVGHKARQMCQKYSAAVWHEETEPTLALTEDEPPPRINVSDCGVPDSAVLIIGGQPAEPTEFPHMAAVGFGHEKNIKWRCGGSLISERFVLTAAHCVLNHNLGFAKWVLLGAVNLAHPDDGSPQQFSVVRRFRHRNYKISSHYDDIALLKLNASAKLDAYVRPACLNVDHIIGQQYFQACGWGRVEWDNMTDSDTLLKVTLSAMSSSDCKRGYNSLVGTNKLRFGIDTDKMVCAGDLKGGKDTCQGDSGGPLQFVLKEPYCMYSIVGVTSFGSIVCGAVNSTAVYTRVSNYIDWIEDIVWS